MALLIKGMGLPKGCASCEFNIIGKCIPMGRSLTYEEYHFYDKVSNDCPLVEVKGFKANRNREERYEE